MLTAISRVSKTLSQDIIELVRNFYENDENNKVMPNKKDVGKKKTHKLCDYVSIKRHLQCFNQTVIVFVPCTRTGNPLVWKPH